MGVEAGFGLLALGMIVSVVALIILIEVRKYDDDKSED
jgi:hypothetical protein